MTTRTWFITGISSGFGREMARQLLERGDRVAGTVRDPDSVKDLAARFPERLWTARLDLTETAEIRPVVDRAFAELGRIDVVVNNAGYALLGAAEEVSDDQIAHAVATNLVGSIQVTRAALPHLRAQQGGRIIQVSTWGGQAAAPGGAFYHATKWGIEGFTEATALDVAGFGIGVTIVAPGGTDTDFRSRSAQFGTPLPAYDDSPASGVRALRSMPPGNGDLPAMVRAILDSAEQTPAPRRVILGSDAQTYISRALADRLEEARNQRESAAAVDIRPAEGR
ncbi:SDR family oxidoreductase [Streptomyces sp. J2-1]|uniref:SDR family oxidoreductase n=1 Tax=Streptomyces corallincola TaxID=2851888 RepID=UPI001C3945A0|nr:SDR family oxidoreductase [Streptomyces corallincola]MBV2353860.1 SDR family oxidoreductase [Streptomyces corallincola]